LHALRPGLRRGRRRPHLGRGRPRRQVARHHRHEPALGGRRDVYVVRQVRHGVPDGRPLPAGLHGGGDGARQGEARAPDDGAGEEAMDRLRMATVWLGGCSGCHMSFLDLDEWLIELAARALVVYSPLADVKEYPEGVDLVLVEGAVANEENLHMIRTVRAR